MEELRTAIAARKGRVENMKVLVENSANIQYQHALGWTPLLIAVNEGQVNALQFLLDTGADFTAKLNDGLTALHISLLNANKIMFSALMATGIEPTMEDNFGTTPLHIACGMGLELQVDQLLLFISDPMQDIDHESWIDGTPLCTAARMGQDRIIEKLLHHGAVINRVGPANIFGSAIMAACAYGHSTTVKLLLSRGAALEVGGSRFGSAAETARAFRQEGILRILEEHDKDTTG